jgi:hypothetical protein
MAGHKPSSQQASNLDHSKHKENQEESDQHCEAI